MVDPGRLASLLDRIEEEAQHLHRLAALHDEAFEAQPDLLAAVKYRFVVAIEAAILRSHVVDLDGFRAALARRALEGG